MKQRIPVIIGKFIAGLLIINYLAYFIIKQFTIYFVIVNYLGDVDVRNSQFVAQLTQLKSSNFFQFYFQHIINGNWGISRASSLSVTRYLQHHLVMTIISYILIIVLSYFLSVGCYYFIQNKNSEFLRKFRGNWSVYLVIGILPLVFMLFFEPSMWIYDGSDPNNAMLTTPFIVFLIVSILISTAKLLSEMAMIPRHAKLISDEHLEFPTEDAEHEQVIELNSGSIFYYPLIALKSSQAFIFDIIFIMTILTNIPGLTRIFNISVVFADIFVMFPIILYISMLLLTINLVIDLIQYQLGMEEIDDETTTFAPEDTQKRLYSKYVFYGFVGMSFLTVVYGIFIGFSATSKIPFLYDPNYVQISIRNLGILSHGHLLGTDYLGRDVFSRLVFSLSAFFLPIVLTILFRPFLVIVMHRVKEIRGVPIGSVLSDILQVLPKTIVLILLAMVSFSVNPDLFRGPVFVILASFFFWSWPLKYYDRMQLSNQPNMSILDRYKPLIPLVSVNIVIELIIITYLGFVPQISLLGGNIAWGSLLVNLLTFFPSKYLPKVMLTMFIIFGSLAGMMRYAQNVIVRN